MPSHFSNRTQTRVPMKFCLVFATVLATLAVASPGTQEARTSDESLALEYMLANSPPGHVAQEDGPAPPGCYWEGTAPFCNGKCKPGWTTVDSGNCGDGNCCWTGSKVLCCPA